MAFCFSRVLGDKFDWFVVNCLNDEYDLISVDRESGRNSAWTLIERSTILLRWMNRLFDSYYAETINNTMKNSEDRFALLN